VPVLAAWLADVLVRHPDPSILARVGNHPLDQRAAGLLGVGPSRDLCPRLREAIRQAVPDPLELADLEDPGPTGGTDRPVDAPAGECRGEQLTELALEPSDLAAQLAAGGAVAGRGNRSRDGNRGINRPREMRIEF